MFVTAITQTENLRVLGQILCGCTSIENVNYMLCFHCTYRCGISCLTCDITFAWGNDFTEPPIPASWTDLDFGLLAMQHIIFCKQNQPQYSDAAQLNMSSHTASNRRLTNHSNSDFGIFIGPNLSPNSIVEAHILASNCGWYYLQTMNNNFHV